MAALAEIKREPTHDKVEISRKYIEASRLLGYKYWTALADLVDNSIDANSSKIQILLEGRIKSQVDKIIIADNGVGMNHQVLKESYNLGARTNHLRSDLGKFGVGGTLGSIALGKTKHTLTRNKKNGKILARKLELAKCYDKDSFFSTEYLPTQEQITMFNELIGDKSTGTLIILEDLDRMIGKRIPAMKSKLVKHFGETYYNHLQSNLSMLVGESKVMARDPICWFHKNVEQLCNEKIVHKGATYNIKCVNLISVPNEEIPGRDLVHTQGIYVQRNERLILSACANGDVFQGFWNKEPRHRFFRALLSFDSGGDDQMGINTDKTSININDQALMDKFASVINPQAKLAHAAAAAKEKSSTKDERKTDLQNAEDIMNKSIIIPKLYSTSGEVEKYTLKEVNLGERGNLAKVTSNNVVEINLDHPYVATYYCNSSEEMRKASMAWIVSLYLSELESGNYSENDNNCSLEEFFYRFEKRLALWIRIS